MSESCECHDLFGSRWDGKGTQVVTAACPVHGIRTSLFVGADFAEEIERRVAEIRALDVEEGKADDLDDRIGIRHRRSDLERWLGRRIVEHSITKEVESG
jgi:hypothetical protein